MPIEREQQAPRRRGRGRADVHRVLSAVAVVALLATFRPIWIATTAASPWLGFAFTGCYVAVFVIAVLALSAGTRRRLAQCDYAVLALAVAVEAIQLRRVVSTHFRYRVDEGILTRHALIALRAGHDPYTLSWPHAIAAAPTQLMNVHVVARFDYPPLTLVFGLVAGWIRPGLATPAFVTGVALLAATVIGFWLLPNDYRPLSVLVFFGVTFDNSHALGGSPVVVAVPFLLLAFMRWPRLGVGGRLGRRGVVAAVSLGLAMAAQQLTWLIVPFFAVGLLLVRRAELSRRQAATVVARHLAIAFATFAVVNLPFAVVSPGGWFHGVTAVFTQHAVLYGPGISMISGYLTSGSGALAFYSYAALLLYLALLACFAVGLRRLGPAMLVLPMIFFLLAIRSEDAYYVVFAPVWLLVAATTPPAAFATARPVPLPRRLRPRSWLSAVSIGGLFVPSLACAVLAAAWPSPLDLRIGSSQSAGADRISAVDITAYNSSGHSVSPHFAFVVRAQLGRYWTIVSGPATVASHQTATYMLDAPTRAAEIPIGPTVRLDAFADGPQTLSSTTHAW